MNRAPESPARFVVAVGSGKGGVGKSTVTVNLALALAEDGAGVGVLDADVYGPNVPMFVNLTRYKRSTGWTVWRNPKFAAPKIEPVERYGLKIMSSGFIVAEDQALVWKAEFVRLLMRQLLHEVNWGGLDYLLVDLPPGTADVQQVVAEETALSGVVVVVTPQDVAHLGARKALAMYRSRSIRVLGAIENMSVLHCPHCHAEVEMFHRAAGDRTIWADGIDRIGRIPLDPELSRLGDRGHPLFVARPASPEADAFREAARSIRQALEN